jgi:phage terminase large subunit-like protein
MVEVKEVNIKDTYRPLYTSPKRYFFVSGGRGSGKSYSVADFLLRLTYESGHVILFTRYTLTAAHISIIPEFTEKIETYRLDAHFDIKQSEIVNKETGSKILFRGIKTSSGNQTANLKSIQGLTTWVLDEAEELPDEQTFDKIDDSIRQVGVQNRVIFVLNPTFKKHWIYRKFAQIKLPDVEYIHTTYLDNIENLSQSFVEKAERIRQDNPLKYLNTYMGEWIEEVEGALWKPEIIHVSEKLPQMKRVVVAIDPSASKDGDECGIVVVGEGEDERFYVLSDRTGNYTPGQWGGISAREFQVYSADCYVAEKNQGGEMVEYVIRQYDGMNRIKLVHAHKGKQLRAEPVVSLYERGMVLHAPGLHRLENEMLTWIPGVGESPNRVDAMVYGVMELAFKGDTNTDTEKLQGLFF